MILDHRAREIQKYLGLFDEDAMELVAHALKSYTEVSKDIFSQLVDLNMAHGTAALEDTSLQRSMLVFAAACAPVVAALWRPGKAKNLASLVRGYEERAVSPEKELSGDLEAFHRNQLFVSCVQNSDITIHELADYARGHALVHLTANSRTLDVKRSIERIWIGQNVVALMPHADLLATRRDFSREFLETLASGIAPVLGEGVI